MTSSSLSLISHSTLTVRIPLSSRPLRTFQLGVSKSGFFFFPITTKHATLKCHWSFSDLPSAMFWIWHAPQWPMCWKLVFWLMLRFWWVSFKKSLGLLYLLLLSLFSGYHDTNRFPSFCTFPCYSDLTQLLFFWTMKSSAYQLIEWNMSSFCGKGFIFLKPI